MHAGGVTAASQTTASWVCELSPRGQSHWVTGTAAPCVSLFKPVDVGTPLGLGPAPADVADSGSMWWRHEQLHRRVMRDPQPAPAFSRRAGRHRGCLAAQRPEPRNAFATADEFLNRSMAVVSKDPAADARPLFVRRYWAKRNRWAGLHTGESGVPLAASARPGTPRVFAVGSNSGAKGLVYCAQPSCHLFRGPENRAGRRGSHFNSGCVARGTHFAPGCLCVLPSYVRRDPRHGLLDGSYGCTTMPIQLTPRERQVVRLLSLGCTVREAALVLKLAPSTVDNHKAKAMSKLGTNKVGC